MPTKSVTGFLSHLRRNPSLDAVAANSAWLLLDKIARALIGLLVSAWIARYLGPTDFGTLAFILAFIGLFLPIANLSADQIIVRTLAQETTTREEVLGSTLAIRLALGTACWALVIAAVALLYPDNTTLLLLTSIIGGTLVFQAADVVDLWFQSQTQSRRTVLAKSFAFLVSSALKVAMILAEAPLAAFAIITTVEAALTATAMTIAYRRYRTSGRWQTRRTVLWQIARQATPFILTGIAIVAYMRLDQILIKDILGARELGLYAAVLPMSTFWHILPMAIIASVAPFMARQRQEAPNEYRQNLITLTRLFFYLGVGAAAMTILLADWLVPALYGQHYLQAVTALKIHAVSNIFCFIGVAAGLWLVNEDRGSSMLQATIAGGIVSIALNILLLPHAGIVGASIAAVSAQAVSAMAIHVVINPPLLRLQLQALFYLTRP
jgi:O-antigen/teichoic acid export membrane protein